MAAICRLYIVRQSVIGQLTVLILQVLEEVTPRPFIFIGALS